MGDRNYHSDWDWSVNAHHSREDTPIRDSDKLSKINFFGRSEVNRSNSWINDMKCDQAQERRQDPDDGQYRRRGDNNHKDLIQQTGIDPLVLKLMQKFRDNKQYLNNILRQIKQSGKERELDEDVDNIQQIFDVFSSVNADQDHGMQVMKDAIDQLDEIIRKHGNLISGTIGLGLGEEEEDSFGSSPNNFHFYQTPVNVPQAPPLITDWNYVPHIPQPGEVCPSGVNEITRDPNLERTPPRVAERRPEMIQTPSQVKGSASPRILQNPDLVAPYRASPAHEEMFERRPPPQEEMFERRSRPLPQKEMFERRLSRNDPSFLINHSSSVPDFNQSISPEIHGLTVNYYSASVNPQMQMHPSRQPRLPFPTPYTHIHNQDPMISRLNQPIPNIRSSFSQGVDFSHRQDREPYFPNQVHNGLAQIPPMYLPQGHEHPQGRPQTNMEFEPESYPRFGLQNDPRFIPQPPDVPRVRLQSHLEGQSFRHSQPMRMPHNLNQNHIPASTMTLRSQSSFHSRVQMNSQRQRILNPLHTANRYQNPNFPMSHERDPRNTILGNRMYPEHNTDSPANAAVNDYQMMASIRQAAALQFSTARSNGFRPVRPPNRFPRPGINSHTQNHRLNRPRAPLETSRVDYTTTDSTSSTSQRIARNPISLQNSNNRLLGPVPLKKSRPAAISSTNTNLSNRTSTASASKDLGAVVERVRAKVANVIKPKSKLIEFKKTCGKILSIPFKSRLKKSSSSLAAMAVQPEQTQVMSSGKSIRQEHELNIDQVHDPDDDNNNQSETSVTTATTKGNKTKKKTTEQLRKKKSDTAPGESMLEIAKKCLSKTDKTAMKKFRLIIESDEDLSSNEYFETESSQIQNASSSPTAKINNSTRRHTSDRGEPPCITKIKKRKNISESKESANSSSIASLAENETSTSETSLNKSEPNLMVPPEVKRIKRGDPELPFEGVGASEKRGKKHVLPSNCSSTGTAPTKDENANMEESKKSNKQKVQKRARNKSHKKSKKRRKDMTNTTATSTAGASTSTYGFVIPKRRKIIGPRDIVVNIGLAKVKMESDYIPIKKEPIDISEGSGPSSFVDGKDDANVIIFQSDYEKKRISQQQEEQDDEFQNIAMEMAKITASYAASGDDDDCPQSNYIVDELDIPLSDIEEQNESELEEHNEEMETETQEDKFIVDDQDGEENPAPDWTKDLLMTVDESAQPQVPPPPSHVSDFHLGPLTGTSNLMHPETENDPEPDPDPDLSEFAIENSEEQQHDEFPKCHLCLFSGNQIVHHYVSSHPKKTIPQACLRASNYEVLRFMNTSTTPGVMEVKILPLDVNRIWACMFCEEKCITIEEYYEHITTHTGEYRYICPTPKCDVKSPFHKNIVAHFRQCHKSKSESDEASLSLISLYKPSPTITGDGKKLLGHLCGECYYFQLRDENMSAHLEEMKHSFKKRVLIRLRVDESKPT